MRNPWLDIPLGDYEAHMALPTIGQARLLADTLDALITQHVPRSIAVLGCAGGNGFDRLVHANLDRVVGIDINPLYIAAAQQRYGACVPGLELHVADIEQAERLFEPVDLIYAGLVFEYLDIRKALRFAARHCVLNGICATVLQQPHERLERVSPSPYCKAFAALEGSSRWVPIDELRAEARRAGFVSLSNSLIRSPDGKQFAVQALRREHVGKTDADPRSRPADRTGTVG